MVPNVTPRCTLQGVHATFLGRLGNIEGAMKNLRLMNARLSIFCSLPDLRVLRKNTDTPPRSTERKKSALGYAEYRGDFGVAPHVPHRRKIQELTIVCEPVIKAYEPKASEDRHQPTVELKRAVLENRTF